MPRASRICLTAKCTQRVPKANRLGYCDEHKPTNPEPWKRTTDYGPRLPASTVRAIIQRDPYCYDPFNWKCKNRSTDVDHVQPRWKGGKDTIENLRGCCYSCHKRKSALEGVEARNAKRVPEA